MMQDEAGEGFQAQLSIALVRVAHMPVGSDQAWHRVEELRGSNFCWGGRLGTVRGGGGRRDLIQHPLALPSRLPFSVRCVSGPPTARLSVEFGPKRHDMHLLIVALPLHTI
jgi:hypothetical protein